MKTEDSKTDALRALRALCRYQTHGGYVWAAVMSDGALVCTRCVRANYREVFRATRDWRDTSGWGVMGLANSGESEFADECAHCNATLWNNPL